MKKLVFTIILLQSFVLNAQIKNGKQLKISFVLDSIFTETEAKEILELNNALVINKSVNDFSIYTYNDKTEILKTEFINSEKIIKFERDNLSNICKSCSKIQKIVNIKSDDKGPFKVVVFKINSRSDAGCNIEDYKNLSLNTDLNLEVIKELGKLESKKERLHLVFWYEYNNTVSLEFAQSEIVKNKLEPVKIEAKSNKDVNNLFLDWSSFGVYDKKNLVAYTNPLLDTSVCLQVQDKNNKCKSEKKCVKIIQKEKCDCVKDFVLDLQDTNLYRKDFDNNVYTIKSMGKNFFFITDYICGLEGVELIIKGVQNFPIDFVDFNSIYTDRSIKNYLPVFTKFKNKMIFKLPYSDIGELGLNIAQKKIEICLVPISKNRERCNQNLIYTKILFAQCE